MKKFFLTIGFLFALATATQAQSGCVDLQEIDGTPRAPCIKILKVTNGTLTCPVANQCTLTISGGGGGGSPGGSNTQVQYNAAGSFGGAAGFTFNGTSTISLGVAGTSVGAIGFRNATSGTITLQPVPGALGTVTLSLPAVTDTLVGLAATQTLTNKTLASPTVTGNISADATSRLIYGSNEYRYTNTTGPAFYDDTTGNILTFNVQSLAANRTVTFPNSSLTIAGIDVANAWADGVKQTFNPDATNAGINVGSVAGDPSAPANGDLWYDSTANELTARINGANVALGSGGGGGITVGTTTVTSGTATRLFYETAGNVVGQVSGVTSDGTNVTAGSGNLRATSPRITTSILDTNGNTLLGITANASATEYITIANNTATNAVSLTASSPTVAASAQAGTPFNLTASPAIAGNVNVGAAAGGSITFTAGNAARLTSGNANGGDYLFTATTGIGTGRAGVVFVPIGTSVSNPGGIVFGTSVGTASGIGFYGSAVLIHNNGQNALYINTGQGLAIPSASGYMFSNSSSDAGGTRDTGIGRKAAGVVRIISGSNGSGGQGSLLIADNTTGGIGTSGVGVFAIANGTAPTSSPADEFQLYSADSAAGDANAFARNEAGEVNRLTGLAARNSSSFAKTSDTTLANITGLTRNVEAGRTYYFETELSTTSANTGGVKFAISGTATATSIDYEGVLRDGTTISAATRATALDTTVCAVTAVTAATCRIRGVIVVNAAGTLTVQFAQNASDGSASTVLVNQALSLRPIR